MTDQSNGDRFDRAEEPDEAVSADLPRADADEVSAQGDRDRPYRVVAWLLIVGALALAALFVSVPAHTYDLDFRRRVVSDIRGFDFFELWRTQTRNLPTEQYEALSQTAFVACGVLFLVGSAYLIWLAMVEIRPTAPNRSDAAPIADGPSADGPVR